METKQKKDRLKKRFKKSPKSRQKLYQDKDWLREQYVEKKLSLRAIEKKFGHGRETIRRWLRIFGLPVRTQLEGTRAFLQKYPLAFRGENSPSFKDGMRKGSNGYYSVLCPEHPYCNYKGCVQRSRLVCEEKLNRLLEPEEIAHHRDGDRSNDTWDNLFVFEGRSDHFRYEAFLRRDFRKSKVETGTEARND